MLKSNWTLFIISSCILFLQLMPTVIFINSVVSVLYHFGLMQMLVEKFAVVMHSTMGTTAAETVCTAASMFLGQVTTLSIIIVHSQIMSQFVQSVLFADKLFQSIVHGQKYFLVCLINYVHGQIISEVQCMEN